MNTNPAPTAAVVRRVSPVMLAAFLLGPAVTVRGVLSWLSASGLVEPDLRTVAALTVLAVAWLPWPMSVPGVWMQRFRDNVRTDLQDGIGRRAVRSVHVSAALLRHPSTPALVGGIVLGLLAAL